jgi:hypothetical protein
MLNQDEVPAVRFGLQWRQFSWCLNINNQQNRFVPESEKREVSDAKLGGILKDKNVSFVSLDRGYQM